MAGMLPVQEVTAELRRPEPGLLEVWIQRHSESNLGGEIQIPVSLAKEQVATRDCLEPFREEIDFSLVGPVPSDINTHRIAWYRLSSAVPSSFTLTLGKVQSRP